jgi:HD-GYP domain-containing protein (c-di-GMP phosphodiesterase class II)
MIKKIQIKELRPGMFISDLNAPYKQHPFLTNSVKVKNEKVLDKIIKSGIIEVIIDTDKGESVDLDDKWQPLEKKVLEEIADKTKDLPQQEIKKPLKEEIKEAELIRKEANSIIQELVMDVQHGKSLALSQVENVVEKVISSVVKNQHALSSLAKIRQTNQFLFEHSISSCALMIGFGKTMGFDDNLQHEAGVGALLHDIGMSTVSSKIINKPGKLTQFEYSIVKKHVENGSEILKKTTNIKDIPLLVAGEHHERYNGNGYPFKLKGEEISIYGQMMSIVDVYDAITSNRGYRRAITSSEALILLLSSSDKDFKGELVQRFIQSVGIYSFGTLIRLANGLLGVVIDVKSKSLLYPVLRIFMDNKNNRLSPYDIDLTNFESDENYKINGVVLPQNLLIQPEEIDNILKLDV